MKEGHKAQMNIHWGHVPFVRFLLFAIAGVCLSCWVEPTMTLHRILWVLSIGSGMGGLMSLSRPPVFFPFFLIFIAVFCWYGAWLGHPSTDDRHFSRFESDYIYGYVVDEPIQGDERVRFRLSVQGGAKTEDEQVSMREMEHMRGFIQVTAEGIFDLSYGDQVCIPAEFNRVAPLRNPGEMDYAAHLAKQNCWHQVYLRPDNLHVLEGNIGNFVIASALKIRSELVEKFGRYMPLGGDAFAIASTLILGYRADLSRELLETYSVTGTIHVLSVSGMHVVIVFWLLAAMLFWMDRHPLLKAIRFPLLVVAIWFYAFLTGLSPSVMRAAMMLTFVLWAAAGSRRSITYNNIAASAFLLLLWNPKLLLNLGFQLSYLAVIGIVFFNPLLLGLYRVRSRLLRPISDYSTMSVSAQAGAFPLAMFYFKQFPVYFLLANLLIVLPATGIMYLGFALLLFPETAWTIPLLRLLGIMLSGLIDFMNDGLYWIQSLPLASLTGIAITWWECVLIYAVMLSLVFAITHRSRFMLGSCLGCFLVLILSADIKYYRQWMDRTLIIHQIRSQVAISYTGRGKAWLYTDLDDPAHSSLSYSVWPHLRRYARVDEVDFIPLDSRRSMDEMHMGPGWIQVGHHSLGLYEEKQLWNHSENMTPAVRELDLLLIRNNPERSLTEILERYPARKLIFDGSNYPRQLRRMVSEAEELGVAHYVLKDNFAYVWVMD